MADYSDPPADAGDRDDTIEEFAHELQLPVARVAKAYSTEWARLHAGATVHSYLTILACRKVRDEFRKETMRSAGWPVVRTDQSTNAGESLRRSGAMFAWGRRMGYAARRFARRIRGGWWV